VIPHVRAAPRERGFDEASGQTTSGGGTAPRFAFRREHVWQPIEEPFHRRRERALELRERRFEIAPERRAGEHVHERAAEIQRAELGQREARVGQRLERPRVDPPVPLPIHQFVEEREACSLQRLQIAANRARCDAFRLGQGVDRRPPRGFDGAQDVPLSDDFGVAGHDANPFFDVPV
jgi:hypothetical protein